MTLADTLANEDGRFALLRRELEAVPDLVAAYVFGSVARGTERPDSDIDVGLLFATTPAATFDARPFALEGHLSELLGQTVQLVTMNGAPPDLVHRILGGILLFDKNPSRRIEFEVRARSAYFDLLPTLQAYRRSKAAFMTDVDLVLKKLAFIGTCLSELERLAKLELLETDVRERRFIEHTLQLAIQACLDVATRIVTDERLGEPKTNHELFSLLAGAGWLDQDLATKLRAAVGFRNILVHGYTDVDPNVIRDVVENHTNDLEEFASIVRQRLLAS